MRTLQLIFARKSSKYADTGGGVGVKKRLNFADVLYGWPLTKEFYELCSERAWVRIPPDAYGTRGRVR